MKKKLTSLMAILLLAVGWSTTASAQAYVLKADDMANWTYKWLPQGATDSVEVNYVYPNQKTGKYAAPEVTDPYQIYDLLRAVYMDKRLPGPFYNAYTSTGVREDPTYYGGIAGGWNIPYGATNTPAGTITYDDIVINTNGYYSSEMQYSRIKSIQIVSGNTTITSWNYDADGTTLPEGWDLSGDWYVDTQNGYLYTQNSSNTITFNGDRLEGYSSVRVIIVACDVNYNSNYGYVYVYVNGNYKQLTSSDATYTWDIQGTTTSSATTTPTDVLIWTRNSNATLAQITITGGGRTLYSWNGSTNGATLPTGAYANKTLRSSSYSGEYYMQDGGAIRIPASVFEGVNSINVSVTGYGYIFVSDYVSDGQYVNWKTQNGTLTQTINFPAVVANDTYRPEHEGYTALVVSLKNNGKIFKEDLTQYLGSCEYTTKDSVINYISRNFKSVKLLTDGLRIGGGDNVGTVFNCDGTYNKFFFLGKGRARKKTSGTLANIGNTTAAWPKYTCEEVPFKFMFEQFSPTTGDSAAQITDFYIEMMDGKVYDVVHDCASVIQNGHQFSMSGNKGTQNYAMSGMNFFVPDYRLKFWLDTTKAGEVVDGRDMNPFMYANANGKTNYAFATASYFAVDYANYNPEHAPKVGLYLLTLDAEANPCQGYANPGNTNYVVTLDWTSSLNEMSGGDVPQTYIIYEVTTDSLGAEELVPIDTVENTTTYDFGGKLWPQGPYSQTHTYIIMGWPTDSDHPSFIAWSNQDAVIIPGLNDFLALTLDHYESDFDVPNMKNWYRNFLNVQNENDANGLTTTRIYDGDSVFYLVRFQDLDTTATEQVAKLKFQNLSDGRVKYTIRYVDENGNDTYDIEPTPAEHPTVIYNHPNVGAPYEGYLTVMSDGDIMIQPNGYDVNFLKIQIVAGNYNTTWTASNSSLPNGWSVSSGSRWILEDGAYYLEGNGYILIPASTIGNYTTATVTINAYGDAGKTAKIKVNGQSKTILNGPESAKDYEWTITKSSKGNAPMRAETTGQVTVGETPTSYSEYSPIYGYWYDSNQQNQMIYTAEQLGNLAAGTKITSITFYPYNNARRFYGGNITVKLGTTTLTGWESSYYSATPITSVPLTTVASFQPAQDLTSSSWTITFDTPFEYNGNNLLVEFDTQAGQYGGSETYFLGISGTSYYSYGSSNKKTIAFQPSATFTYTTEGGGGDDPIIQPTVDGMVRMGTVPMVDEFSQEIPVTNDHPYRYTYYLKLANSDKQSSMASVPVQHTGAEVEGYYSLAEMDNDTIAELLTTDVISAEVDMNLSPASAPYFYTLNSVYNGVPESADDYDSYVSVLQRREAGDYQEMFKPQSPYVGYTGEIYPSGDHDFFDFRKVVAESSSDYMSYVPIVWTKGIDRHYYVTDSLHNSYGAPIWKTAVGKVEVPQQPAVIVEKQSNQWGSTDWSDGTNDCSLYMLDNVTAYGHLPSNQISNVTYEPYMFRIFVECPNKLRGFENDTLQNGGIQLVPDNSFTNFDGPLCVYSEYVKDSKRVDTVAYENPALGYYYKFTFNKDSVVVNNKVDWSDNAMFGGLSDIITENPDGSLTIDSNLKIYVRFYYKVKDLHNLNNGNMLRALNANDHVGYAVETQPAPKEPSTSIAEKFFHGEIVSQTYVNAQGMVSDKPFNGINIVVTRYSDGTTTTSKVVR